MISVTLPKATHYKNVGSISEALNNDTQLGYSIIRDQNMSSGGVNSKKLK